MSSDDLLSPMAIPEAVREATSPSGVLQAMLDAEAALARAQAGLSLIPGEAASTIAETCSAERFDLESIERDSRADGNPVAPLVRALRAQLPGEAADYVHLGATSQDILDTALSLVSRRALEVIVAELDGVRVASAALAEEHRQTLMAARTLLQQALPTTFGLKAAGWLLAAVEERRRLAAQGERLAVQLGGAAGTLAWFGDGGDRLLGSYAKELGLAEPVLPWHTSRARVAELGSSVAITAGALGKVALDVVLLAQSEVGEVSEGGEGRGASSTLPQKRNPIGSVSVIAAAKQARACGDLLVGLLPQEHERAAGAWHAEWRPLCDALRLTAGAAATMAAVLADLEVDTARMRENAVRDPDALVSEHAVAVLAPRIGRIEAETVVREALAGDSSLRSALAADERAADLPEAELESAVDPASYLGSSQALIDRALGEHRATPAGGGA